MLNYRSLGFAQIHENGRDSGHETYSLGLFFGLRGFKVDEMTCMRLLLL